MAGSPYQDSMDAAGIAASLGYTPANKAGDTFTGAVVIDVGSGTLPAPIVSPTQLRVAGADNVTLLQQWDAFGPVNGPIWEFRSTRGTRAVPTATQSTNTLFTMQCGGYGATAYAAGRGSMTCLARENFSDSANGCAWTWQTVPIGGTTAAERFRIDHDGSLLAQNASVTLFNSLSAVRLITRTAAQILDKTNTINTTGKAAGTLVLDTTNNRVMVALGALDVSNWEVVDGSAAVTPV